MNERRARVYSASVARRVIGFVLLLTGVIWIGQGVGLIGGSFMTGQAVWAVIGAVAGLLGLALIRGARHGRDDGLG